MEKQYESLTKYDRVYAGLLGGNNLQTKATTIEYVQNVTGETETYIIQTIRGQDGDYVVIKFMDKEGVKRLILPPRVANTIERQHNTLTARSRSIASKAAMKERMDRAKEKAGLIKQPCPRATKL